MQIHTKCLKIKRNVSSTHEIHIIQQVIEERFWLTFIFPAPPILDIFLANATVKNGGGGRGGRANEVAVKISCKYLYKKTFQHEETTNVDYYLQW